MYINLAALLGRFDCYLEKSLLTDITSQHGETGDVYPLTSETYLLGLCTGSLPAAAISCCESISQLIPLAVQTVLIALRTGLCAANVGNRIEKPAEGLSSWSTIVHGLTGEDIPKVLKDFSEANVSHSE